MTPVATMDVLFTDVIEVESLLVDVTDESAIGCSRCSDASVSETRLTAATAVITITTIAMSPVVTPDRCDSNSLQNPRRRMSLIVLSELLMNLHTFTCVA